MRFRVGLEAGGAAALHHRGVVRVGGENALAVHRLVGVANHPEQRLRLRRTVDQPVGVEDLVSAVLGVRLREHHQFRIRGVAAERREGVGQVVHFVRGEREAQAPVRGVEGGARIVAQRDVPQRAGRGGQCEQAEVVADDDGLGHAVAQRLEAGWAGAVEVPADASLHPRHGAQAAAVEYVRRLARPRRDRARTRHHGTQRGADLGRQVALRAVAEQLVDLRPLVGIQSLGDEQEVDELGEDAAQRRRVALEETQRSRQPGLGEGRRPGQNQRHWLRASFRVLEFVMARRLDTFPGERRRTR